MYGSIFSKLLKSWIKEKVSQRLTKFNRVKRTSSAKPYLPRRCCALPDKLVVDDLGQEVNRSPVPNWIWMSLKSVEQLSRNTFRVSANGSV